LNSYLQRLATHGSVESMATDVRPLIRSRSPIAEEDQRIGMPGFGNPNLDQTTSIEGTLEERPAEARTLDSALIPPKPTRVTGNRTMEAIDLPRPTNPNHTTKSIADMLTRIVTRPVTEASRDIGTSDRTESSPALLDTPADFNGTPLPLYKTVVPRRDGNKQAAEVHFSPSGESSSSYLRQIDDLDSSSDKSDEARATRLEPTPRAILSPGLRQHTSSQAFQTSDKTDQEPRVVIGRINVEVVPPVAESKTTAPPRPGPLTAESVSVIGPLSRRVGSSLRLNLKYR